MNIKIYPKKLCGKVSAPSSKSFSHRMIIAAALSDGVSEIENVTDSVDITATVNAMNAFGADITKKDGKYIVSGIFRENGNIPKNAVVDCCESGSTLRFIIPVACALGVDTEFHGRGKLPERPITPYLREMSDKGVCFDYENTMPFSVSGKLMSGVYSLEGDISSQFITGLLFALPLCEGDSEIRLTSPLQSKPYADMTIDALKQFGVEITETDNNGCPVYHIKGSQKYKAKNVIVEGDYSQAAFFYVANALGSEIEISNLSSESSQGDKQIVDIIRESGDEHKPFTVDVADIPDLVPILSILGCFTNGESRIVNAARLKIKESDRLTAIADVINTLGGKAEAGDDSLTVYPTDRFSGGIVDSYNDHRIVMSAAIASTRADSPVIIKGCEAVNKSYPAFFEDLASLGAEFEYTDTL